MPANKFAELKDLATWVLTAPIGEPRAVSFRADGNDVVTIKRYLGGSLVETVELTKHDFKKHAGLPQGRHHEADAD